MKTIPLKLLSLLFLAGLLLHPSLSFKGAGDGLLLWFNVVFPTLFPFLVATSLVTAMDAVPLLMRPFRLILRPVFGLGDAGCYTFLTGLLCGYPVGARNAASFVSDGRLTKSEGAYLLSISAYPSLMFVLGYVLPNMSPGTSFPAVFLSLCLPALPISLISRRIYRVKPMKERRSQAGQASAKTAADVDALLMSSLELMEKICAYLMLFSIAAAFWNRFVPDAFPLKTPFLSLLEMTVGIRELSAMSGVSPLLKDACIVGAAAFGGLSGAAQTRTVIKNAGLSIRHYVAWKWVHLALSSLIFILLSSARLPAQ